jgi:hypothetical protein
MKDELSAGGLLRFWIAFIDFTAVALVRATPAWL